MSDGGRPAQEQPAIVDIQRRLRLARLNAPGVDWSAKVVCPAPCGAPVALICASDAADGGGLLVGLYGRSGRIENVVVAEGDGVASVDARCRKGHPVEFDASEAVRTRRFVANRVAST